MIIPSFETMQNDDYGTLVKPINKITGMLGMVEITFHKNYTSENILISLPDFIF